MPLRAHRNRPVLARPKGSKAFRVWVAAIGLLVAHQVHAEPRPALPAGAAREAVELEDGTRLWFVELPGAPTAAGGDANVIEQHRASFRSEAAIHGLRYRERGAFSRLWNGLSIAVDTADVEKLDRLGSIQARFPVLPVWLPDEQDESDPQLLTALAQTGADVAQDRLGLSGAGVRVAIIDTGVDYDHPDLGGDGVARTNSPRFPTSRIVGGYDFVGDDFNGTNTPHPDPFPDDCYGHGTHVAGILAANGGVRGVAPGASLKVYRVFGCTGSTPADILIAAMERAFADGVDVVNMSLGHPYAWPSYPTCRAADELVDHGVVVVASMGNSGATGLYSGGVPGIGAKVLTVGAFENTHVNRDAFSVSPDARLVGYSLASAIAGQPLPLPPPSGPFSLMRVLPPESCEPFADGSLTGKVALVRRGSCGTIYARCRQAQDAGAAAVVVYDYFAGVLTPDIAGDPPITIPVVGITPEDGGMLQTRLDHGPVEITWGAFASIPNPGGGTISWFSSYGPTPDLDLKPELAAPGGFIRSTYPLELGGHTNLSGTSMSSPHVAGAVALLLQAHPGLSPEAVRDRLMNTADPHTLSSGAGEIEPVHHQGAGMLNVPAAILTTTRIEPGKLALGESEGGPVTRTLEIHNDDESAVTYDLWVLSAAGTDPNTFTVSLNQLAATVRFSENPITVAGGHSARVKVTIAPDPEQPARSVYGGYLVFAPRGGGSPSRVAFMGLAGDYQTIPTLTKGGPFDLPWLVQKIGRTYYNRSDGATYTLAEDDIPIFFLHFNHPASRLRMELMDANTDRPRGLALDRKDLPRGETEYTAGIFPWNGEVIQGKHSRLVPNGRYVMRISVLRALGDEHDPDHWEQWTSPVITLARPGGAARASATGLISGPLEFAPPQPNPSSGDLYFRFVLPEPGPATIEVFDVSGRRLRRWSWDRLPAGEHSVRWDGTGEQGRPAAAGSVICRFSAMGRTLVRKAVRLR